MNQKFLLYEISLEAPEESEAMGTKEKFWFHHEELGWCLYKKARPLTGESWSEKIAAELCRLLKLPHAQYELALYKKQHGVISPSFLPLNGSLTTGNEILAQIFLDYPQNINDLSQHTLVNVFQVMNESAVDLPLNWQAPLSIKTAIDTFVGYLLLDSWIGNSDRHHENWGFINLNGKSYLAPTYDHASSLGRNEADEKRRRRLETKDRGFSVSAYANKCKSCLYAQSGNRQPLKTFDVFCDAAKLYPKAANIWLNNLKQITAQDTLVLFDLLPDLYISPTAIDFAQKILEINKNKLIDFQQEL
ncbi:MAG: HipA-like protein [Pleurocapsa minor HA4230-MV1]|jgi:hypothetical protein|nr:HipA-like protein [Pleurocapsa minor HA4230-MV1]